LGWQSLVIWECELASPSAVQRKVQRFLRSD
jgi:G:T-mismatch repair DNA endonuclease (very short patch repair protein)